MQDIPKLFQKEMGSEANIGFTMFARKKPHKICADFPVSLTDNNPSNSAKYEYNISVSCHFQFSIICYKHMIGDKLIWKLNEIMCLTFECQVWYNLQDKEVHATNLQE